MVCIYCSGKTSVVNSRPKHRINQIWRRRQCLECGAIFTSREIADFGLSWTVKNSNGQFEPFSRDKLFISIYKSVSHRASAIEEVNSLVDTLITKLGTQLQNGLLDSSTILHVTHVALSRFDKQAAMHYQSFHRVSNT
jgi:transcriptional repressor NrdR